METKKQVKRINWETWGQSTDTVLTVACISLCIRCARATWKGFPAKHLCPNWHLTSHCCHTSHHVMQDEDSPGFPAQHWYWPKVSTRPSEGRRGKSEMNAFGKSGYFQLTALRKMKCSQRIFLKLVFIKNKNLCDLLKGSGSVVGITGQ